MDSNTKNQSKVFGLTALNKEIQKFVLFSEIAPDGHLLSEINSLFVLVLTGVGANEVETIRGKVLDSASAVKKLSIPKNMQVLVLTEADNRQILGQGNLQTLRDITV